jgi:type IV fimbrial biogenesis protein FimT
VRHLNGFTLIELMIGIAIAAMLLGVGAPYLGDYVANSRLREAGNAVFAETLYAQSEAIRRNATVRVALTGSSMSLRDMSVGGAAGTEIRATALPNTVQVAADVNLDMGSDGRPTPFGTNPAANFMISGSACTADLRCPGLRIDSGGAVRLCPNRLDNCP